MPATLRAVRGALHRSCRAGVGALHQVVPCLRRELCFLHEGLKQLVAATGEESLRAMRRFLQCLRAGMPTRRKRPNYARPRRRLPAKRAKFPPERLLIIKSVSKIPPSAEHRVKQVGA